MKIRLVRDDDYPEIARLRRQTIRHVNSKDYSEEVIESWSSKIGTKNFRGSAETCKRWVAVEKEKIIGFCEHTFECEVSRMYVHKEHLRKGVGSRLLEVAEASLKKQGCKEIHIESTVTAKDFYEKNGYIVLEKTLYKGNTKEPIYKMEKRLFKDTNS
ncbi:MAG: GNAT family N-acetyltransferase [Candidatus Peregrinibacteria bacterium]|nr:GNAT family N-acetyltransferase [Candidatus Peregrinibacteria bacterium]